MMRPNADGYSSENTDMVDSPDDPTAQNAATAATKPKAAINVQPPMPALAPLNSGADRYTGGEAVNNDPNAYQPPPQQMTQAMDPYAGGGGASNGPPTSGGGMGLPPAQPQGGFDGPYPDTGRAFTDPQVRGMGLPPEMTKPFNFQRTDDAGTAPVLPADLITPQPLPQVSASGASMGGQGVPAPSNQVFNYIDPVSGERKTAASSADVPGIAGRASAGLVNGGTSTAEGDSSNAFKGYVSAEGGGFGGGPDIRAAWTNATGLPLGSLQGKSDADVQAATRLMAAIGNGDAAAIAQGVNSAIPEVRDAARMYTLRNDARTTYGSNADYTGAGGKPVAADWKAYTAKQTGAKAQQVAGKWGFATNDDGDVFDHGTKLGNINDPGFDVDAAGQKSWADRGITQNRGANGPGGAAFDGQVGGATDPATIAKNAPLPINTVVHPGAAGSAYAALGQQSTGQGVQPLPPKAATDVTTGKPTNTAVTTGAGTPVTTGGRAPAATAATAGVAQGTNTGVSGGFPQLTSSASGNAGISTTPTTADNALTNSTLARGPGADRFKIAGDQWDAFQKSSDPAYQASLRDANRMGAAAGGLGSGQLRTSLGDLASNRALQMDTQKQNFLSDALKGTISDQFGDLNQANQQQGFQQGQQQQGFNNEVQKQTLQEMLTGGNFNRGLQALTAGGAANPADVQLLLSQIFGNNASAAGSSLSGLLGGLGKKSTSGGQ